MVCSVIIEVYCVNFELYNEIVEITIYFLHIFKNSSIMKLVLPKLMQNYR